MPLPRLTLGIPSFGPWLPPDRLHEIVDVARRAEQAGVDTLILPDHVVMSDQTDRYTWGPFPLPIETPFLEPLTVLAAIAGATSRVRLATGILIAPLRPAALLAKTVATLDVLSRGRVELGVGVGWQKEEFDAEGLDYERRGRLLTDTIAACRELWSDSPASFHSESVSFEKIWCEPKPVQQPLPVWFSGTLTPRNLDRIVRLGDGWIPIMNATREDLADGARRIREAWDAAGRDPQALRVRGTLDVVKGDDGRPHLERTLAGTHALAEAGATDVQLAMLAFVRRPERQDEWFAALREAWSALGA
jgi:probable F420-dependent oxidoreductase